MFETIVVTDDDRQILYPDRESLKRDENRSLRIVDPLLRVIRSKKSDESVLKHLKAMVEKNQEDLDFIFFISAFTVFSELIVHRRVSILESLLNLESVQKAFARKQEDFLNQAIQSGYGPMVRMIVDRYPREKLAIHQNEALRIAGRAGNPELLKILLAYDVVQNEIATNNNIALRECAGAVRGHYKCAAILCHFGADINVLGFQEQTIVRQLYEEMYERPCPGINRAILAAYGFYRHQIGRGGDSPVQDQNPRLDDGRKGFGC